MQLKRADFCILLVLIFTSTVIGWVFFNNLSRTDKFQQPPSQSDLDEKESISISEILEINGKISGNGLPANVTLNCNKSESSGFLNSNSNLNLSVPDPWMLTYTNLTVRNIFEEVGVITVEDEITPDVATVKNNYYAMEFNVTQLTHVINASVYVKKASKITTLIITIYNATLQGAEPAPDIELYQESLTTFPDGGNIWVDFIFSSGVEINPLKTYANAFFIEFYAETDSGGAFDWYYTLDSAGVDSGAAYHYVDPSWELQPWDFNLEVGLGNPKNPTEIDLKVNGTAVNHTSENNGEWISTAIYSDTDGTVKFQFSSNVSAIFFVEWFGSYHLLANHGVNTYFTGYDTQTIVYWNASYDVTFITDSDDRQMEFKIPAWKVMNVLKDQSIYLGASWDQSITGRVITISIYNATDALWTIQCNDTNYIQRVFAKRNAIIVSEINSTDPLEIFGNFTEMLTNGDANLTIFPVEANYNDIEGENIINNKTIKFSPILRLNNTAIASFSVAKLQVTWFNGTAAGINSTLLTIHRIPTNITYLSHTSNVDSGQSVYVNINY
ncbi:MAG: hypothetical protein ACFFD2_19570, partial [Promethearchaeota archaeon]